MINLIPIPKKCVEGNGYLMLGESIKLKSDFELPLLDLEHSEDAAIVIKKTTLLAVSLILFPLLRMVF